MALDLYSGSFTYPADDSGPVAVTGVGFTPKLLLFWTAGVPFEDEQTHFADFAVGFSDGTSARSVSNSFRRVDTGSRRGSSANALMQVFTGGDIDLRLDVASLDGDGFSMEVPADDPSQSGTNVPSQDVIIYYMAFGGDDVVGIDIGSFNALNGNSVIQELNPSVKPDFMMFLSIGAEEGTDFPIDADGKMPEDAVMSVGILSKLSQFCVGIRSDSTAGPSFLFDTMREAIVCLFGPNAPVLEKIAVAQYSEFELPFEEPPEDPEVSIKWEKSNTSDARVFYLAVEGMTVRGGISKTPPVATKEVIPGLPTKPQGMILMAGSAAETVPSESTGLSLCFATASEDFQRGATWTAGRGRFNSGTHATMFNGIARIEDTNANVRAQGTLVEFGPHEAIIEWNHVLFGNHRYGWMTFGPLEDVSVSAAQTGQVVALMAEGAEITAASKIQSIVWSGAKQAGHYMRLGESSSGTPATTLVELTASKPFQTQQLILGENNYFENGFQLTMLDSGSVYVYLDGAPLVVHNQTVAATGNTVLVTAPGAGLYIYVVHAYVSVGIGANNASLQLTEGAGGTTKWQVTPDDNEWQANQIAFTPAWKLPVNTALAVTHNISDDIYWTVQYYIAP